jgi:gas vesicle protein
MNMKTNGSSLLPYIVVGSAIGGAVGYLFATDAGKKIRRSVTHPNELAVDIQHAGDFVEHKAAVVASWIHEKIDQARRSIEEGQFAYREAGDQYRLQAQRVESKSNEITAVVHDTVDSMSNTALHVGQSVLNPIVEIGALVRGFEKGIRSLLGKTTDHTIHEGPVSMHPDRRVIGS